MKFKCINGWTKAKMLKVIRARRYNCASTEPGGSGSNICLYLSPNGNKCAVGLFIPRGHEGQHATESYSDLIDDHPDLTEVMPLGQTEMMLFQREHDRGAKYPDFNAKQAMIDWVNKNVK